MDKGVIEVGGIKLETLVVKFKQANLVLVNAPKGFIMCGYLNIEAAQKMGDAACIITGVSTVEELLAKPVVNLTTKAEDLGITRGITGEEALKKML
ncbi:MAG: DUF1805 domain-containing protein [Candidatus Omnitrophota bacterium]